MAPPDIFVLSVCESMMLPPTAWLWEKTDVTVVLPFISDLLLMLPFEPTLPLPDTMDWFILPFTLPLSMTKHSLPTDADTVALPSSKLSLPTDAFSRTCELPETLASVIVPSISELPLEAASCTVPSSPTRQFPMTEDSPATRPYTVARSPTDDSPLTTAPSMIMALPDTELSPFTSPYTMALPDTADLPSTLPYICAKPLATDLPRTCPFGPTLAFSSTIALPSTSPSTLATPITAVMVVSGCFSLIRPPP